MEFTIFVGVRKYVAVSRLTQASRQAAFSQVVSFAPVQTCSAESTEVCPKTMRTTVAVCYCFGC